MKYRLNRIYFYLTEGCNLCCRHCWIDPKYQSGESSYNMLDFELFKSIIRQARPLGLSGVKLTGGEPLLHPKIYKIIDFIKEEDLRLIIETNGLLCTEELARKIKGCRRPFVSVSVDGANAETHEWVRGIAGSFDKALEGIRILATAGLRPQLIMTIMRRNKEEASEVVRLAEKLGCGSVKFNIVQPTARGNRMHIDDEVLSIEELVTLGAWVDGELAAKTRLALYYSHPPAFRSLGRLFGEKADGCGLCGIRGILGVLANGAYALCGIGQTVPELVFGDANERSLKDVWNNTPVLEELREGLLARLGGICGDCIMKGRCLGSCLAQNYYRTKNLWVGFWYCEEADAVGLFPGTRKISKIRDCFAPSGLAMTSAAERSDGNGNF